MDMPAPNDHHQRLATFVGTWRGEERMFPSPWMPEGGTALGTFHYRMIVDGFFLVSDYTQARDGRATYSGHGVYGWDGERRRYTMMWFDSMGGVTPAGPNLGDMHGDALVFVQQTPRGFSRFHHELTARDGLLFRMEGSSDGERWSPLMEGRYTRKG